MNEERGIGAAAVLIFKITTEKHLGTRASASFSSNIHPAFIANFQNDSVIEFRPTTTKIENFFNVENKETRGRYGEDEEEGKPFKAFHQE